MPRSSKPWPLSPSLIQEYKFLPSKINVSSPYCDIATPEEMSPPPNFVMVALVSCTKPPRLTNWPFFPKSMFLKPDNPSGVRVESEDFSSMPLSIANESVFFSNAIKTPTKKQCRQCLGFAAQETEPCCCFQCRLS